VAGPNCRSLGRGLMLGPKLIMLDEPSFGLALQFAQRGYVLENGRVVLAGSARDVAEDPRIKTAYLGL
jgi:branched-chain amino acid transport system ATP-binding protein